MPGCHSDLELLAASGAVGDGALIDRLTRDG